MKYLVIVRTRSGMPPERAADILRATKEWINASRKDGSLDFFYGFTQAGGVGVANADSHEAFMRKLRESPSFPFLDIQVEPLVDINLSLDTTIQMFQKMAAR